MAEREVNYTESEVLDFVEKLDTLISKASKLSSFSTGLNLANQVYEARFLGTSALPSITLALHHLLDSNKKGDYILYFIDQSDFRDPLPQPFWNWKNVLPSGKIPGFEKLGYLAYYQSVGDVFIWIDTVGKRALWTCVNQKFLPDWEQAAPYRLLFQHLLAMRKIDLLHAASVALDGVAVLLTGHGGAGKSTASLSCLNSGFQYLGDDFVAVSVDQNMVFSLYQSGKILPGLTSRFPQLEPYFTTPIQDKLCLFAGHHFPEKMIRVATIQALVSVKFCKGQADSTISVARRSEIYKSLIPNTLALLHANEIWIERISTLISRLPGHQLFSGENPELLAEKVKELLQETHA